MIAGRENPELLEAYADVEQRIGHTFRTDISISEIRDAVATGDADQVEDVEGWCCS